MAPMAALSVDPLLSYARRLGEDIKLVLVVDTSDEPVAADAALRLHAEESIDVPISVTPLSETRTRVEAVVSTGTLADGTWRMKLVAPDGERSNLQTRVLIRSGMPIALLPGRPPRTLLPEPAPRH
jgi:hypothetical protein